MRENPTQPAGAPAGAHPSKGAARPRRRVRDANGRTPAGSIPVARPARQHPGAEKAAKKAADLKDWAYRFRMALIVVAVAAFVVLALYPPIQQYYVAWRTNGELKAQSEQVNAEHEELQQENDNLMSLEGIGEKAREKGYVEQGETALKVEGLPEEEAPAEEESQKQETPWYLSLGDFIFQYQGQVSS